MAVTKKTPHLLSGQVLPPSEGSQKLRVFVLVSPGPYGESYMKITGGLLCALYYIGDLKFRSCQGQSMRLSQGYEASRRPATTGEC